MKLKWQVCRIVLKNGTSYYDKLIETKQSCLRFEAEGWVDRKDIEEFWPERPASLRDGKLVLGLPKPAVVKVVPVAKPPVPKLLVERPPAPRISVQSQPVLSPMKDAVPEPAPTAQAYANRLVDGCYVVTLVGLSMEDVVKVKAAIGLLKGAITQQRTGMKRIYTNSVDVICDFCGEIFQSKREYKDSSKRRSCGQVVCKRAYKRWHQQKQKVLTL